MISSAGRPVIQADNLGKSYGVTWALRGVRLEVGAGEAVAVFGANGAGKSTLLRLLATLSSPSCGTLQLMGRDAGQHPQLVRAALGVLVQQSYLYAELTAAENLALYADLYGVTDGPQRVREVLADIGLSQVATRRVRTLSRGMQQRLALARAMIHRPALLLLDEPDSGLDAAGQRYLAHLLRAGCRQGQAVVLATHRLDLGLEVCGRALILAGGRVVYEAATHTHNLAEWRTQYHQMSTPNR